MTMSLDGFVAHPDDRIDGLFDWYDAGPVAVGTDSPDIDFHLDEASAGFLRSIVAGAGALVCGRRLFDITDGWGDRHPLGRAGRRGDRTGRRTTPQTGRGPPSPPTSPPRSRRRRRSPASGPWSSRAPTCPARRSSWRPARRGRGQPGADPARPRHPLLRRPVRRPLTCSTTPRWSQASAPPTSATGCVRARSPERRGSPAAGAGDPRRRAPSTGCGTERSPPRPAGTVWVVEELDRLFAAARARGRASAGAGGRLGRRRRRAGAAAQERRPACTPACTPTTPARCRTRLAPGLPCSPTTRPR